MKRIIIDHTKVTDEILNIIMEDYPDGYTDRDVLKFKNHKGELIEALEIKLNDDIYLVKVGTKLDKAITDFNEDDSDEPAVEEDDLDVDDDLLTDDEDEDDKESEKE
ncbi:hypothetical protein [Wenyingzhuangia sp. 2_MG-2023]|uniref:hypothetical protein n=1 Tax=Wenyingzhuangia sp. 2_MG-2023 TaxID=3062639 RepID=UPI0026E33FDB|nr:hypothetical protein [Wenyingzhuangia sp. 2_MG-2023]MDO6738763.1 hypothetical protein [Wenyingzhuangia sp. 2_MG-2023]MDO6801988.1 hypothetical protein [Wenyingzhuangia sp. 1_MG-2023]